MNSTKPAAPVSNQPKAMQMDAAATPHSNQTHEEHENRSWRMRGGGAAKDCFLGALECFLCFECCKECCGCFADIVCCPCEMCC